MKAFVLPTVFTAVDKFTSPMAKMSSSVDRFVDRTAKKLRAAKNQMDNTFTALGGKYVGLGIVGGLGLAGMAVRSFVKEASKVEDATAFFTPVLGSVEKANKLVQMLNVEAANTPFVFNDISNVASSLLPLMNGDLNKVISTFRLLGDTAGGNVDKLQRITLGYTKALLKGKVTLESLNIIAEAGVPIFSEMAKAMNLGEGNKGTAKLFKMITKGLVPTEALTNTFEKMTSKGGLFYQGMIISSKTFNGITSTLEDNIAMTSAAIGAQMLPILKEYALKIIDITGRVRAWIESHRELIATKFREFMDKAKVGVDKFIKVLKWAYQNIDKIILGVKIYIGTLMVLKVTSMAIALVTNTMTVAMFAWRACLLVSKVALIAFNGIANLVFLVDMIKYVASTRGITFAQAAWLIATQSCTAAMAALNAVMLANPIGLIIAGIVLLIAYVALVVKYWDKWGAAIAVLAGPIGLVISLVMSFVKNWDMVMKSFKDGGILSGIKAIGVTLLDAVLMPLHQIVKLIADITGADWARKAANSINAFRADMGVNINPEEERAPEVVNPREADRQELGGMIKESVMNTIGLNISTQQGTKAEVTSNKGGIPIKTKSTHTYGQ